MRKKYKKLKPLIHIDKKIKNFKFKPMTTYVFEITIDDLTDDDKKQLIELTQNQIMPEVASVIIPKFNVAHINVHSVRNSVTDFNKIPKDIPLYQVENILGKPITVFSVISSYDMATKLYQGNALFSVRFFTTP